MQTSIYVATDVKSLKSPKAGHYGYLLQATKDGKTIGERMEWKEGTGDTYGLLLQATEEAAGRIKPSADCGILIITDSQPLADGIHNLHKWEKDGWKRSKGRAVARKEEWQRIAAKLKGRQIAALRQDISGELERMKGARNV